MWKKRWRKCGERARRLALAQEAADAPPIAADLGIPSTGYL
jgi:hypothetical protein